MLPIDRDMVCGKSKIRLGARTRVRKRLTCKRLILLHFSATGLIFFLFDLDIIFFFFCSFCLSQLKLNEIEDPDKGKTNETKTYYTYYHPPSPTVDCSVGRGTIRCGFR